MRDDVYEETLEEYAEYFRMDVEDMRELFLRFLHRDYEKAEEELDPFERAIGIGIYRIVKLKGAFRMGAKSRELWKGRAKEAGWNRDV